MLLYVFLYMKMLHNFFFLLGKKHLRPLCFSNKQLFIFLLFFSLVCCCYEWLKYVHSATHTQKTRKFVECLKINSLDKRGKYFYKMKQKCEKYVYLCVTHCHNHARIT